MRGADTFTESPFTFHRLEDFVPPDHPLRTISQMVNEAQALMDGLLSACTRLRPKSDDPALHLKDAGAKLRSIPVRLIFGDPDINLRASYSLFDRGTGRPLCVGNGETCQRSTASGIQTLPCPSPEACELALVV